MPDQRLTLYDFIVDLIPGLVAVGLIVILVPQHSVLEQIQQFGVIASTLGLLAGGYVVGRIIHGLTGVPQAESFAKIIARDIPRTPIDDYYLELDERVKHVLSQGSEDSIEYSIARWIVDDLRNEISTSKANHGASYHIGKVGKEDLIREPGQIDDLQYMRYLADSTLYSRQNLSWKYSILATFFRNLWPILLGFGIVYLLAGVFLRPELQGFSIVLLGGGIVSLHQRFKFKRRQIRAIINELYLSQESSPPTQQR